MENNKVRQIFLDMDGLAEVDLGNGTTASQKFGGWINKNAETGATTVGIGFIDSIKKDESDSSSVRRGGR